MTEATASRLLAAARDDTGRRPRVAIFGPNPLLTVTIEERRGAGDDIHIHLGEIGRAHV